ncbi:transposase [Paenibacillus sp. NPDC057934]|uniref:transposase n=1 Tax=Paenibacillus sp. NPDC057934 TaxID=3346282 RepID=UPI0036DC7B78
MTSILLQHGWPQSGLYGKNKEHGPLPQMNLALLFGEQSNLPFYYRKLPGNISDVQTLKNLLAKLDLFTKKIKLVMDRGFYGEANINAIYQQHLKFLIGVKVTLKYVQAELETAKPQLQKWENFHPDYNLYAHSATITWKYSQPRLIKAM